MTIITNEAYAAAIFKAAADPYDTEAVLNLAHFTRIIGFMPTDHQRELSVYAFRNVPHLVRSEAIARVRSYLRGQAAPPWLASLTAKKTP